MDELTLARLDPLPKGGWVEFNDPELLRGKDVDRLREAWQGARIVGQALNATMQIAAEMLVAAWDLGAYLPAAPLPAAMPSIWGEVAWRDKVAIERHIRPVVLDMVGMLNSASPAASPPPPASE